MTEERLSATLGSGVHVLYPMCAFDWQTSHTERRYVCYCGWRGAAEKTGQRESAAYCARPSSEHLLPDRRRRVRVVLHVERGRSVAAENQASAPVSGGSFDHAYTRVETFAEELEERLGKIEKEHFKDATIERLWLILREAQRLSARMKAVEWLFSGDDGERTFREKTDVSRP